MARKIEYKNLVQEIEAAHADVTWRGVLRAFFSFKNVSLILGKKPLSREPCSGLLGSAAIYLFYF